MILSFVATLYNSRPKATELASWDAVFVTVHASRNMLRGVERNQLNTIYTTMSIHEAHNVTYVNLYPMQR